MNRPGGAAGPTVDEAEFAAVVERDPRPIAIVDQGGAVVYANGALLEAVGHRPQALGALLHPEDVVPAADAGAGALRLRESGGSWLSCRAVARSLERGSGGVRTALYFDAPSGPEGGGVEDVVTGLPGRQAFLRQLDRSVQRARIDPSYRFAVLLADLDGFKLVNDSLGRERGDELLRAVARRLMDTVRPGDKVAQLGADEFAILVDRLPAAEVSLQVAHRVQRALDAPFVLGSQEVFVQAGIGVALGNPAGGRPDEALRDATTAMNRAKAQGPGRIEVFDQDMRARALARLRMETDLRRGVERDEFTLHYQPIVSLRGGEPIGFEVLMRWRHPERGLVSPAEFIPAAEQTGLIVPLSSRLLAEACAQVVAWQRDFPGSPALSLSMNFAATQFERAAVRDTVLGALEASGLPASCLVVEITESVLMTDFDAVIPVLRDLRERGVRVHLDDFGTGYSSLSYLSRLPVDSIKIDRSFVARLDEEDDASLLVRAIVDLARSLGKQSIAEGIERASHADKLRAFGCDYAQGYLFARPMDRASAERWLADARPGPTEGGVRTPGSLLARPAAPGTC